MSQDKEGSAFRRRDFFCIQLFGVFMFAVGIVGGLLIGIYAYHGSASDTACSPASQAGLDKTTTTPPEQQTTTAGPVTGGTSTTDKPAEQTTTGESDESLRCEKRDPFLAVDKPDEQLFAPLTADEMNKILNNFVAKGLATTKTAFDVRLTDNYITAMYNFVQNKTAALEYIDNGGQFPGRYARVHVTRGANSLPDLMEYVVGPLGSDVMTATPQFADGELVYTSKTLDIWEYFAYLEVVAPAMQTLVPLTTESFDGAFFPNGGLQLNPSNGSPGLHKGERDVRVMVYFNPWADTIDSHYLDFLPLSFTIHCAGNNVSSWRVSKFYYLNQGPFDSAEDLMAAYNNNSIRKFKHEAGYRDTVRDRVFPDRDTSLPLRENAQMPPPRTYDPEGPRYKIQGHRITWMDWSFHITTSMLRGPALFDVKFKGERVVYELATNEFVVLYGSDSSGRNNIVFTDASYGVGSYSGIVPAVDCPEHATLLEASAYDFFYGRPSVSKSVCVFEADGEDALWRHKPRSYFAGLRNTYLVVRATSNVGNYDIVIEFRFLLDGKLHTKVTATGFIAGTFWDTDDPHRGDDDSRDAFGFRVSDFTHGMVHDHMYGFKVDMDIIDRNNSFEMVHFKAGDVVDALNSQKPGFTDVPSYFIYNETRYLEYETLQNESSFLIDLMKPVFWTVVNENHRNKWGAKRGYLISPLATSAQTMVHSHPAMQALSFTKHHCTVTKHKDTEQYLNHVKDTFRLDDPIGALEKQVNGENVVNEDIVNWVTVGFNHIPTSEDVPMTIAVETGFVLRPFNFVDRTAVFDMPQYTETTYDPSQSERPPTFKPCLEDEP